MKCNTNQKVVLLSTVGVLMIMLLFPPFIQEIKDVVGNHGYHFIFAPPSVYVMVHVSLLLVQLLYVSMISIIILVLFRD